MRSDSAQPFVSDAPEGLLHKFFSSVSFARGQTPAYARIRELALTVSPV
jgi:hypothetical protein